MRKEGPKNELSHTALNVRNSLYPNHYHGYYFYCLAPWFTKVGHGVLCVPRVRVLVLREREEINSMFASANYSSYSRTTRDKWSRYRF